MIRRLLLHLIVLFKGIYYVGINPPAASSSLYFYAYNTSVARILDMPFPTDDPQRAVWLYNDSLMYLIIQRNQSSTLVFLNWYSASLNFTYNRTVSVPFNKPYGFAKSNDDTIYGNRLASWNMSASYTTLYDMVLTPDYEIDLLDNSTRQLFHYGSSLKDQCTIT